MHRIVYGVRDTIDRGMPRRGGDHAACAALVTSITTAAAHSEDVDCTGGSYGEDPSGAPSVRRAWKRRNDEGALIAAELHVDAPERAPSGSGPAAARRCDRHLFRDALALLLAGDPRPRCGVLAHELISSPHAPLKHASIATRAQHAEIVGAERNTEHTA